MSFSILEVFRPLLCRWGDGGDKRYGFLPKPMGKEGMKMNKIRKILTIIICCLLISVASAFAQESYPTKAVSIIVPFAPGGSLDLINRILSEKFRQYWKQPVLVVNKPGANAMLAAEFVATSKPDGYNIYAAAGMTLGYFHLMNPNFSYGLNNFSVVTSYAKYPLVIIVNKNLGVKTVAELVAYAKKNPKALTYGTTGYGSTGHFSIELLKRKEQIPTENFPPVHYAGVAPSITAILGNQVQLAIMPLSAVVTKQMESGDIRALAVTGENRSPFRSDIPTIVEAGFPELANSDYLTYMLPAKTPVSIVKSLEDVTKRATEDKEVREKILDMYHEIECLNSQEVVKLFEKRVAQFGPLIKELNIVVK
jgi:tripartite-type tricarboxylate transporter receptor subunit TctC